jgi:hypothetical protein
MGTWTPGDWGIFFAAAGTFVGVLITGILQIITLWKTAQSKAVSVDNNQKINALVSQTNVIADAVPGASTTPTDHIIAASRNQGA